MFLLGHKIFLFFFSLGWLHSLRYMFIQFNHDLNSPLSRNQGFDLETQHQ